MALIGLLSALDPSKVVVDLFVYSHQGPLMEYIPDYVNLLPEIKSYSMIERSVLETFRSREYGVLVGRMLAKIRFNINRFMRRKNENDASDIQYVADGVAPFLSPIQPEVEYDLCISFLTPHNFGLKKVRAKKRVAWIHTDYSKVSVDVKDELPIWAGYDNIVSISESVTNSFVNTFPILRGRIQEIENFLPVEYILKRAAEQDVSKELTGQINLLSIGRFCNAKNYDNVPDICRRIRERGVDVKWYIIGYGGDEQLIRSKIRESGMEDYVIILGKKTNPYPYIKACDVYVQPSRYEGKSVTVREAQILGKPVIITEYPTAKSQIHDGFDGIIVPLQNEDCAVEMVDFIRDPELQATIIDNLRSMEWNAKEETDKLYRLINNQ